MACARARTPGGSSWRELLLDLRRRGLAIGPELAVADGALGCWQALEEVGPKTRGQRCWGHKTVNVLNKLPTGLQSKAKRALQDIWMAETKPEALIAFDACVETYGVKYDKAVACLVKDRDALLAFYDFPAEHWKHLRTTNPVESTFATIRHRTVRAHRAREGLPVEQDRSRHDLQAGPGRREELAAARWSPPLAEGDPGCHVHRWRRGRQPTSSSRCRLTPTAITNIRRYLHRLWAALLVRVRDRPYAERRPNQHRSAPLPILPGRDRAASASFRPSWGCVVRPLL